MHILFFISSLQAGGAERVASELLNYWVSLDGIKCTIVTYDNENKAFYKLSNNIVQIHLNVLSVKKFKLFWQFMRLYKVTKAIFVNKPDIVVSFMDRTNVIAILACMIARVNVVVSERCYPPYYNNGNLFDRLRKFLYRFCNKLVVQTDDVKQWAEDFLPAVKIEKIYNPMTTFNNPTTTSKEQMILAVGRLTHLKGFDLLISAYALIYSKHKDWRLIIVGSGEEKTALTKQINDLGLEDFVTIYDATTNISFYYQKASIFVLSSRTEGFPNVLLEAMSYNIAPIALNCKTGPSEIIENMDNGILISYEAADEKDAINNLANAIKLLISNQDLRNKIAENAILVKQKYAIDNIGSYWIKTLKLIVGIK